MTLEEIIIRIKASAAGVGATLDKVKHDVKGVEDQAKTSKKGMSGLFAGVGAGSAVAAGALGVVGGIALKGAEAFQNYGGEIKGIQRMLGDSSQQASLLAGQWELSNVAVDKGTLGMKMFQKNLYGAQQALTDNTPKVLAAQQKISALQAEYARKPSASLQLQIEKLTAGLAGMATKGSPALKYLTSIGVSMKDASGHWLSGEAVIEQVRGKLAGMTSATERTALAQALFGKGGAAMLPWLMKSNKAIADQTQEVKGLGLVWSQADMTKFGTLQQASDSMKLGMEALQVKIGMLVIPIVNKLIPAFTSVVTFLTKLPGGFWKTAAAVVGLLAGVKLLHTGFTIAKNAMEMYSGVSGTLNKLLGGSAKATETLATTEGGEVVASDATTASLGAQLVSLGLLLTALAAAAVAIYAIVKAYQSWKKAADEAAKAAKNAKDEVYDSGPAAKRRQAEVTKLRAEQAHGMKLTPDQLDFLKTVDSWGKTVDQSSYKAPQGIGGWAKAALGGMWDSSYGHIVKKHAAGADFITSGTTPMIVGEAGPERVTVTPLGKGHGGGDVHVHIGQVIGTDSASARAFAATVANLVMVRQKRQVATGF